VSALISVLSISSHWRQAHAHLPLEEGGAVPLWAVKARSTPGDEVASLSKVVVCRRRMWQANWLYCCPAVHTLCCKERALLLILVCGRSSASLSWNNMGNNTLKGETVDLAMPVYEPAKGFQIETGETLHRAVPCYLNFLVPLSLT